MKGIPKKKAADSGKKKIKVDNSPKIDLLSKRDKITLLLFICLFVGSLVALWYLIAYQDLTIYSALPTMAIPFFVIGVIFYIIRRRFIAVIAVAAISLVAYLLLPVSVLFIVYLLVCTEGVAQMVEIIQRGTFYSILASIERVNVKDALSLKDKLIVFLFNIPVDIDTRNLKIDKNIIVDKIPWKDMLFSMMLALLFCMFLWIYLFLNPSFDIGLQGVPIYTFTIVLYLSMIVMPWSIFSTLNARIDTEYRAFKIYSGFLGTFARMFLPIFAALIFLIIAVSSGPDNFYYVAMSLVMIVVMITFTSIMYYTSNEVVVVNDIVDKWGVFHPSSIYSGYSEAGKKSTLDDGVPGTPRRDPSECFIPDITNGSLGTEHSSDQDYSRI